MLLFTSHVLGELRRWWNAIGQYLADGPTFYDVYLQLLQAGAEGQALWSVLAELDDNSRIYTVLSGAQPMVLRLFGQNDNIIVADIRLPDTRLI